MSDIYDILRTSKGKAYSSAADHSLLFTPLDTSRKIRGNSRVHGDVSEENRKLIIDKIISVGARYHLNYKDIAYALLMCKVESGFNPDAAAGTSSAGGLAQNLQTTVDLVKTNSKNFLGFEINIKGTKVFDVDTGVYCVILDYMFNKSLADKWGFKPNDSKYWQLIYMLHHDGPGYYQDERGKQRALKFHWSKDAIDAYNRVIKNSLEPLTQALSQSKVETKIKLTGSDGKPVTNKDYVIAVPQNSSPHSPTTLSTNRQAEKKEYKVVHGKTDDSGFSLPILAGIGDELIALLLPKNFRELGELSTGEKHTVKKGETLSEIAKENHTTVDQIAKDNHIKDKNKIAVGQELIINAGSESHVVKHGETLEAIAKRYHVSVDDVAEANHIKNKNLIHIGQKLTIPKSSNFHHDNHETASKPVKQLRHKPSNSAIQDIMETLGISGYNLHAINFTTNHTVKPTGSVTSSQTDKHANTLEIKTPVAAEAINEKTKPKPPQPPVQHATDQQGTVKPTKIKVNDGCAIIYTFQDMDYPPRDVEPKKGYTVFYDHLGNKLISITSGSRVDSGSKKGADGPMSETFTGIAGGYRSSNCKIAYGTTKILHTDRRLRWIHGGGGGSTKNPAPAFREHQPWRVTMGCTRAQNIDLENLAAKIREFQKQYPKVKIKCIRNKTDAHIYPR